MPFRRRPLPSFFHHHSERDSISLPDYYRSTRLEQYGPYYRSSEPVRDLMKTIDLRGRESPASICALPDIFEDGGFELDDLAFRVEPKLKYAEDTSVHYPRYTKEREQEEVRWLVRLWGLFLSTLRRCRRRQTNSIRSAGRRLHFELAE